MRLLNVLQPIETALLTRVNAWLTTKLDCCPHETENEDD